jgi:NAD(P)-dependent dehydrogenase (short-subunit alcohol dehydrogenase family)
MMDRIALVTGADRGLGFAMTAGLLDRGWRVFAGQFLPDWPDLAGLAVVYPGRLALIPLDVAEAVSVRTAAQQVGAQTDRLDLLINNAGINPGAFQNTIRDGVDYPLMQTVYEVNSIGPLRVTEAFVPLMARGGTRRLCFVSSEAGSIGRSHRAGWFGYCMSKAALNMGVSILFNDLRADGFTFRLYHPGWIKSYMRGVKSTQGDMEPEEAAVPALAFFLSGLDGEPPAEPPYDEDRLVLRDWRGQEWPW